MGKNNGFDYRRSLEELDGLLDRVGSLDGKNLNEKPKSNTVTGSTSYSAWAKPTVNEAWGDQFAK